MMTSHDTIFLVLFDVCCLSIFLLCLSVFDLLLFCVVFTSLLAITLCFLYTT